MILFDLHRLVGERSESEVFYITYKKLQITIYMRTISIIVGIILIAIDQVSKVWAVNTLAAGDGSMPGIDSIELWQGVFHLQYTANRGGAWGILSGKQGILILITSIIIIGMLFFIRHLPKTKWGDFSKVAFILVISGAIGNLIDRVLLGYVRDFFYFILIEFPIFNFADIFVVVGMSMLIIAMLFGDLDGEKINKVKGLNEDEN